MKSPAPHLSRWLFFCCFLVGLIIIVGAITRLSGSGLSIVEWKPLMGALPPLNEAQWQHVFDLYKQSPQYIKENSWMSLADFKAIFFWEWFHRLLGRLIGLAYALPLLWFFFRKQIPSGAGIKLIGVLLLGGAQGFMGWYMVKSGLVDNPQVSHYRLATHLGLALLVLVCMFWLALGFRNTPRHPDKNLHRHGLVVLCLTLITIFWGALTAGLDAGLVYNETFPKMGGTWLPPDLLHRNPLWINFFENHVAVQFTHRWLAVTTALAVLSLWGHALMKNKARIIFHLLAAMACAQAALGIATLLSGVALPLAVAHQSGAVILLLLLVYCLYEVRPRAH